MKKFPLVNRFLPFLLLVSSIIISCKKEPSVIQDQPGLEIPKITKLTTYSVRNELLPYYYQDKNGVEYFSRPLSMGTNFNYTGCYDDYLDNLSVMYLGSYVNYDCGNTGQATINMVWTFVLPANTVPSVGTNTRIRYRFSTSDPYSYSTSVTVSLHTNTYTNPSTGQSVKKWYFSGTFDVPSGEYCMKNAYYGSMYRVETDCSDNPPITNAMVVDYLTPATYSVNTPYAFDHPSTPLTFSVWILTTLCFNCHEPSLGASPEYILRYRLVGTSGWTYYGINQSSHTPDIDITVASTGTYEYEYSGKLTAGGSWTPYIAPSSNTFTVL